MIWTWWLTMAAVGVIVGCLAAWSSQGLRVLLKTLVVPLVLAASRLLYPAAYPMKNTPPYLLIDLLILAAAAFVGDYLVGLCLGRHGLDGYRSDSVGH